MQATGVYPATTVKAELDWMQVRRESVRATVETLTDCLLKSGMSCALADSLISPVSNGEPAHYISTLFQLGQDSQVHNHATPRSCGLC